MSGRRRHCRDRSMANGFDLIGSLEPPGYHTPLELRDGRHGSAYDAKAPICQLRGGSKTRESRDGFGARELSAPAEGRRRRKVHSPARSVRSTKRSTTLLKRNARKARRGGSSAEGTPEPTTKRSTTLLKRNARKARRGGSSAEGTPEPRRHTSAPGTAAARPERHAALPSLDENRWVKGKWRGV